MLEISMVLELIPINPPKIIVVHIPRFFMASKFKPKPAANWTYSFSSPHEFMFNQRKYATISCTKYCYPIMQWEYHWAMTPINCDR